MPHRMHSATAVRDEFVSQSKASFAYLVHAKKIYFRTKKTIWQIKLRLSLDFSVRDLCSLKVGTLVLVSELNLGPEFGLL